MTDKKDLTDLHDLSEFNHEDDPEVDAQLEQEFKEKTTLTSLGDLDEEAESLESSEEALDEQDFENDFENDLSDFEDESEDESSQPEAYEAIHEGLQEDFHESGQENDEESSEESYDLSESIEAKVPQEKPEVQQTQAPQEAPRPVEPKAHVTSIESLKEQIKDLSYSPSQTALGPQYSLIVQGNLFEKSELIQRALDDYQLGIDLNDHAFSGPLRAGKILIPRLNEFLAYQVTIRLKNLGLQSFIFHIDQIDHDELEGLDPIEVSGIESEILLEQNIEDEADFDEQADWDGVLITKSGGIRNHKLLRRSGPVLKIYTLTEQVYNDSLNQIEDFDRQLKSSQNLPKEIFSQYMEQVYKDLCELCEEHNANCVVNFEMSIEKDYPNVLLKFTGDMLGVRKVKSREY